MLGSFANVIIYRLPRGENIAWPGSHCPKCQAPIRWFHNVPIFGWLVLRGRCASCKQPISYRYPLVELLMASLFLALYLHVGIEWRLIEYFLFVFGLVVITFIDFDHMIIPDVFSLSGIVIGLLGAALNPEREFWPAFAGVLMGGGFLWAVAYVYMAFRKQEGMGGGDIKLLAWIGAVLGWTAVPFVLLSSSLIGSVVGLIVAFRRKEGLKSSIPFGPYLALGAILFILGGEKFGLWYVHLFLPSLVPAN